MKQETPIVDSGKSEKESNMAAPTTGGKKIDQELNKREEGEREDMKKSSYSKLDLDLDIALRNIEQETPIVESGESEEGSNMTEPMLGGKRKRH